MRKRAYVFLVVALIISLIFYFNVFSFYDLFGKITGNPILADDGFVRNASDFGTGRNLVLFNKDGVSLSPNSSNSSENSDLIDSGCVIDSVSWSEKTVEFGGNVQIVVYGEGCDAGGFDVEVFEKDTFFNDGVTVLEGSFENGRALIDFDSSNFNYLFDEIFEGDELEIYFEVDFDSGNDKVVSSLLTVFDEGIDLGPSDGEMGGGDLSASGSGFVGRGCNNYQYIDKDCDGYVIGGKNRHVNIIYNLEFPPIPELGADADDNDPALNTPASVTARYGDFTNINNFKNYLRDLGYTHQINNVYFISLDGNDLTGQPNNINLPYRHRPVPYNSPSIIIPGDVVVYREGTYSEALDTDGSAYPNYNALQGTATQPILLISYPGERVIFTGNTVSYPAFKFTQNTKYTIVDGFELDGETLPNQLMREVVSFGSVVDHVTLKNADIRNGERWGIFGYGISGRDYVTLDNIVIHHIRTEHCLYRNDAFSGLDTDIGWVISNSLFYACDGHNIHWRGGTDFTFENNTFHSSRWNNIEIKNSATNGIIRNNLFFNAGRAPLVFYEDNDAQREQANGIDNILVTQNIFAARAGSNGVNPDASAHPAVQYAHNRDPLQGHFIRTHRNIRFINNIFYVANEVVFNFDHAPDISETTIEKNIFYRVGANPPNDWAGMSVCDWTDRTHNAMGSCHGRDLYIWNFADMHNSTSRPQFRNNLFINPLFMNVNNLYTTQFTPRFYNFLPTQNSPNIGFALPQYTTPADIRGVLRDGSPDAGAYEYDPLSASTPFLLGTQPQYFALGTNTPVTLRGYNFNSLAELEICDSTSQCNIISNSNIQFINSQEIRFNFNSAVIGAYRLRVVNPGNVYSVNRVVLTVQGVPARPTELISTSVSPTSVSLSWQDNSNNENGFHIERSLLPTSEFTRIGTSFVNDNTFTDTTVSPGATGITYYYRVRAFNYVLNSEYSDILRVDVPPALSCTQQGGTICLTGYFCSGNSLSHTGTGICCDVACQISSSISAPVLYTYPIDANSIQITWVDTNSNEEGFQIEFMPQGGTWGQIPGANSGPNTESTVHNGLVENTRYNYRMRAYIGSQFSSYSNQDYSITPPNTPTNLVVTRLSSTQARLDWRDNSNGELNFRVQRCTGAGCTTFADLSGATNLPANTVTVPSTVTYTDNTLSLGVEYVYRVRAEQSWWSSLWSNTASTVSGISVPNVPSGLTATALSATSMRLNWNDNSNNEQGFTLQYKLSTAPESSWANVPGASNLPSGNGGTLTYPQTTSLVANTAYNYRVRAYNAVGNSAWYPTGVPYPTGTTFNCNPNQQESCDNRVGVCAGATRTCSASGQWSVCNYPSTYASVETGASLCIDRLDNDCDGEGDYDGAGVPAVTHGDGGCTVSITGINVPIQVFTSSNFNLDCTSSPSNVNSIIGTLDGVSCGFVNWFGNVARFNCASSSTPRVQVAQCDVNISKSYRTGTAMSSNVNVVSNVCSSYSTLSSCEAVSGNICDWVLGCSGTRSNGFGDRCVPTGTGTGNYMCRYLGSTNPLSCGATCDGTVNGCSQTQNCDLNSCGCVEQNPSVSGINPSSLSWGSSALVTVTGSYFASNAELLVDGNTVTVLPSTRTATSLQFNYGNRMFRTGTHSVTVRNPTSGRVSNSRDFSLSSNPTISSIVPNVLSYVSGGSVEIIGTDLDPIKLMANGLEIPNVLWSSGGDRLVNLGILGGIVPGGNYDFVVVNRDNANSISSSFNNRLRINWVFDYLLSLSSSGVTASPQSSFDIEVNLQSVDFMDYEDVIITVNSTPEVTVVPKIVGLDRCKPDLNCTLSYTVNVGNVIAQDYVVTFTGTSEETSKEHSQILTIRGEVGGSSSSGGGSSGGGGGGRGRPKLTLAQCNDKKDNDGDGLIDFNKDLGCDSLKDNNEVNIDSIVTRGNYTFGEELEEEETPEPTEKDIEIRVVFWSFVLILVIGIAIVGIVIMRHVRRERRFKELINRDDWR